MRKERKRKRQDRNVKPNTEDVKPKLPWYAGASDHFGTVVNKYQAQLFFDGIATTH